MVPKVAVLCCFDSMLFTTSEFCNSTVHNPMHYLPSTNYRKYLHPVTRDSIYISFPWAWLFSKVFATTPDTPWQVFILSAWLSQT